MRTLIILVMLLPLRCLADYERQLSISLGMVSISLSENQSNLQTTDQSVIDTSSDQPESSSVSSIAIKMDYDYYSARRYTLFLTGIVPMVSGDGSAIWIGSTGFNYFYRGNSSIMRFYERGTSIAVKPTYRFYLGAAVGLGYVIYNTVSERKTDVAFELGAHGGIMYTMKNDWGLKGEIAAGKWTGVLSNSIAVKLFVGAIYSI